MKNYFKNATFKIIKMHDENLHLKPNGKWKKKTSIEITKASIFKKIKQKVFLFNISIFQQIVAYNQKIVKFNHNINVLNFFKYFKVLPLSKKLLQKKIS